MGAVVEIWFESLIPFLLKDSHIVQCMTKPLKWCCTVSQQQFQPRMQITQDFIFDKLICYSYVQEYVIE